MEITYRNEKLKKICTTATLAEKTYGLQMAEKIQMRIDQIAAADSVEILIRFHIGRCHALVGNRKGEYAMDLVHPYRLVFKKMGTEICVVHIWEIIDYH